MSNVQSSAFVIHVWLNQSWSGMLLVDPTREKCYEPQSTSTSRLFNFHDLMTLSPNAHQSSKTASLRALQEHRLHRSAHSAHSSGLRGQVLSFAATLRTLTANSKDLPQWSRRVAARGQVKAWRYPFQCNQKGDPKDIRAKQYLYFLQGLPTNQLRRTEKGVWPGVFVNVSYLHMHKIDTRKAQPLATLSDEKFQRNECFGCRCVNLSVQRILIQGKLAPIK